MHKFIFQLRLYLPAWKDYETILKDNPSDYYHAFCQMVYAMKCLRGEECFEVNRYDSDSTAPWEKEINAIIEKRQCDAEADWKAFGEKLSGCTIEPFDIAKYQSQYAEAGKDAKDDTFLGKFFLAAMRQKSMVTKHIYESGNLLAGFSVDYRQSGFKGIKDFRKLLSFVGGDSK